jgi:transcriptional regulator with XRE-family HTH domain
VNPVIDARLQMSLSSQGLAKKLGVSRQYIQRAEAGTYTSLNPALLKWTAQVLMIEIKDAIRLYEKFQSATRRATVDRIGPHKLERHNSAEPSHVLFERWRSGYWPSAISFANAFCIHPDTISRYEEGISKEMPMVIRQVLIEMDLLGEQFAPGAPSPERRLRAWQS